MFKKFMVIALILLSLGAVIGCGAEPKKDEPQQENSTSNPYDGTWGATLTVFSIVNNMGNIGVSNGKFSMAGNAYPPSWTSCPSVVTYRLDGSIDTNGLMSVKLTGGLSPSGTSGSGACNYARNDCIVEIDFYPCGATPLTALFLELRR